MSDLVTRAAEYAKHAHREQVRKYTGEPYFNHCASVARIVEEYEGTAEMIAAALLHDVVEDCPGYEHADIKHHFGHKVYVYAFYLTNQSTPADGNRAARKKIDREHIFLAPPEAQTIKLADLIDNTSSIVEHDPNFAHAYLLEKQLILEKLTRANPELLKVAWTTLREAQQQLVQYNLQAKEEAWPSRSFR